MPTKIPEFNIPPAVLDPAWLPDTGLWPELEELRRTHVRLRAATSRASSEVAAARERKDEYARFRQEAIRDAYRVGAQPIGPDPERDEQLDRERRDAQERSLAATAAPIDFINEAVKTIAERRAEWLADLDRRDAEHRERVAEAQRGLAELKAQEGRTVRLRHWVDRTGGEAADLPATHIQYSGIPTPAPEDHAFGQIGAARNAWIEAEMRGGHAPAQGAPRSAEDIYYEMLKDIEAQEATSA
jgi:hypothetical protein